MHGCLEEWREGHVYYFYGRGLRQVSSKFAAYNPTACVLPGTTYNILSDRLLLGLQHQRF